jgi:spore germination cell wall hydrolase CwlJ-like protein
MRKAKLILIGTVLTLSTMFGLASYSEPRTIEIAYSDLTKEAKRQVDCLAENIYHEAGYEPEQGKQAVALVTLNRTQDERFPSNICGVVKQKTQGTCQFSWFCMPVKLKRDSDAYKESMQVALFVYANYEKLKDITSGAIYYHADYVNPRWRGVEKTTKIGRHIFYKEKAREYDAKT